MNCFDISGLKGELKYRLTNDMLFHIVMMESDRCLVSLLSSLLSLPLKEITDVEILNPIDYYMYVDAKNITLDIKLELNHTSIVDIEMQVSKEKYWDNRVMFYSGRLVADQNPGKHYENLKNVHHIGILDFEQEDNDAFYRTFRLMSNDGKVYYDKFQIHTLNLRNIANALPADVQDGLVKWGRLFSAGSWEEIQKLADEDDIFREAGENMRKAMVTQEDLLRRREDAIRDYEWSMSRAKRMAKEEGRAEGIAEGKAEGRTEAVKALMDNLEFSFEKAIDALNISAEEAEQIKSLL